MFCSKFQVTLFTLQLLLQIKNNLKSVDMTTDSQLCTNGVAINLSSRLSSTVRFKLITHVCHSFLLQTPFGYSRKDVLLIGLGVTVGGIALESGLEVY